ncbi:type II toxin-antitoxin system Phd/YefM family antitoxin [Ursidibacter sp. B-7004-1]
MEVMTYSTFRNQLAGALDRVNENHTPILITRQNAPPAVVMSLEDFQSYEETAYLIASPNNALRLNQAISQVQQHNATVRELIEE